MKIKSVIVASIVLFTATNSFATFSRETTNGGPNGYDKTEKKVDDASNTTIKCWNPGYEKCPESFIKLNDQHLYTIAIDNIKSGNLKGSYSDNTGTVTWSSDESMRNSIITGVSK